MCPFCGTELVVKVLKFQTRGRYCEECKQWFSPFDSTAGLTDLQDGNSAPSETEPGDRPSNTNTADA